ncbi:hypothetical protein D3C79_938300 [compost metagenome]
MSDDLKIYAKNQEARISKPLSILSRASSVIKRSFNQVCGTDEFANSGRYLKKVVLT